MSFRRCLVALGAAALTCLAGGAARAQTTPDCTDTAMVGPNPIYLTGSTAFQPTAQAIAVAVGALTTADRATIIYKGSASCDGANAILNNSDLSGTATYFVLDSTSGTPVPAARTCNLATGTKADIGVSDVFFETCDIGAKPATLGDVAGPAQAMLFIVPNANTTTTSITAQEAQLIWGCGMTGAVTPFTDENGIQQRTAASGTQNIIARHINVPANAFKGKSNSGGGDLVTSLLAYAATNPNKAIGFFAADGYDTRHDTLNSLAFRGFDQTKAFYADSVPDNFDKKNVRDGHYLPWGPTHFMVQLGSNNMPSNAKAAKFLGWIDGSVAIPTVDFTRIMSKAGVIPQCAMKVQRSSDGGFLSPYTPADPCGCFFESVATSTATPAGCTACTDSSTCTGGKTCHHNFCE